jgi:hypothetical protein
MLLVFYSSLHLNFKTARSFCSFLSTFIDPNSSSKGSCILFKDVLLVGQYCISTIRLRMFTKSVLPLSSLPSSLKSTDIFTPFHSFEWRSFEIPKAMYQAAKHHTQEYCHFHIHNHNIFKSHILSTFLNILTLLVH